MDLNEYLSSDGAMTVSELAAKAGIRHSAQINQWRNPRIDRKPGFEHAAALERATEGKCTCEELNPKLPWVRIAATDWPWHPNGRPLINPAPAQVREAEAVQS